MTTDDRLLDYALGTLAPEDREQVEAAVAADQSLQVELRRLQADFEILDRPDAPESVPAGGRERLLRALEAPPQAFLPFLDDLKTLFDLDEQPMLDVLAMAERDDFHEAGVPGVRFLHFQPGPALAGAEAGLVRFDAAACFPEHTHRGRELTYVLRGSLHFSDGRVLRPGDQLLLEGGQHSVRAGNEEVLYVTFHEGLDVLD